MKLVAVLLAGLAFAPAIPLGVASAAPDPASAPPPKAAAPSAPQEGEEDADFARRLAALKKAKAGIIEVAMAPGDDPAQLPARFAASGGLVMVTHQRSGIYVPPLLSPEDIKKVVDENLADIRVCYKKQLEEDAQWADELILDLAVKKTGRVSEVSIAPGRVRRSALGQCLMSSVPKWKFPEFTGESDDGIVQEVVNASFPFSFSTR
jgi:hypothetical protein